MHQPVDTQPRVCLSPLEQHAGRAWAVPVVGGSPGSLSKLFELDFLLGKDADAGVNLAATLTFEEPMVVSNVVGGRSAITGLDGNAIANVPMAPAAIRHAGYRGNGRSPPALNLTGTEFVVTLLSKESQRSAQRHGTRGSYGGAGQSELQHKIGGRFRFDAPDMVELQARRVRPLRMAPHLEDSSALPAVRIACHADASTALAGQRAPPPPLPPPPWARGDLNLPPPSPPPIPHPHTPPLSPLAPQLARHVSGFHEGVAAVLAGTQPAHPPNMPIMIAAGSRPIDVRQQQRLAGAAEGAPSASAATLNVVLAVAAMGVVAWAMQREPIRRRLRAAARKLGVRLSTALQEAGVLARLPSAAVAWLPPPPPPAGDIKTDAPPPAAEPASAIPSVEEATAGFPVASGRQKKKKGTRVPAHEINMDD